MLVVRETYAGPVEKALSPLHQAWTRIGQRRFTARGRTGIVTFPLGDGLAPMVVRRYMHGGVFGGVLRDLYWGPDRAMAELAVSEAARLGGVRTLEAIGVLCQRAHGPFWRLAFLSCEIADSEDMIHYACRLADYPEETAALEKRGAIREASAQIRKMHDLGIFHADLHLKNLLLRRRPAGAPEVFVIDFDKAVLGPPLSAEQRLRNLKRLARSIRKVRVAHTVLTAWDRVRFLRDYVHGQEGGAALLRDWAKKLASAGAGHEVWWAATGAKRNLRGDRVGWLH